MNVDTVQEALTLILSGTIKPDGTITVGGRKE
jgi:hypothetical protein